jgi:hypothetical protein
VGVVLRGEDASALDAVTAALQVLLGDPELPERCRRVAREMFDVDAGSRHYLELYDRILAA